MNDPLHPDIATRFRAALRGERGAAALEALRAAGVGVCEVLSEAEQVRAQLVADGQDLWDASPAVGGYLAAAAQLRRRRRHRAGGQPRPGRGREETALDLDPFVRLARWPQRRSRPA